MKPSEFKFTTDELAKIDPIEAKFTNFLIQKGLISDLKGLENSIEVSYLPVICEKDVSLLKSATFKKYLEDGSGKKTFSVNMRTTVANRVCTNKKCEFKTCPVIMGACAMLDNANDSNTLIETKVEVLNKIDQDETYEKRKEILIKRIDDIVGQPHIKEKLLLYINKLEYINKNKRSLGIPKTFVFKGINKYAKREVTFALAKILYFFGLVEEDTFNPCDALFFTDQKNFSSKLLNYVKNLEELGSAVKHKNDLYSPILKEVFRVQNRNIYTIIDMTDKLYLDIVEGETNIKSVIDEVFQFDDYKENELLKLFYDELSRHKISHSSDFDDYMSKYINRYIQFNPSVKNIDIVEKLISEIFDTIAERKIALENEITIECLPKLQDKNFNKDTDTFESQLDKLVGLSSVKREVSDLVSYLKFLKKVNNKISTPTLSLHSVFSGNPGTGKTTIARIYADTLYTLGYIKENKLIEVARQDLVAGYIGQTAVKTQSVIDKAMGGVLFIDEAYTLNPTSPNDFGHECIATLIKAMEDRKGEFVVIFAGYKDDMEEFMGANDGVVSRINSTIEFEDYKEDELYQIFYSSITGMGLTLHESAEKRVREVIKKVIKVKNFGNGRFIMKLKQATLMQHSLNTKHIEDETELLTIRAEDIVEVEITHKKGSKITGFTN